MTDATAIDRDARKWNVNRLTGLAITLDVIMQTQAILNELIGYNDSFTEACAAAGGSELYSSELRAVLSREVKRLPPLQDATRAFSDDLSGTLLWGGPVGDDLGVIAIPWLTSSKIQHVSVIGFDRPKLIRYGQRLINLLRRCQAAVAAMHIAANELHESLVWSDDPNATPLTELEERQFETLESLRYWADNDIDRVRSLLTDYSRELDALQQVKDNTNAKTT